MKQISYLLTLLITSSIVSCVPARKLEELQLSYDDLNSQYKEMKTMKEFGDTSLMELKNRYNSLSDNYNLLKGECDEQRKDYEKTQTSYELLNKNYKELVNSNENKIYLVKIASSEKKPHNINDIDYLQFINDQNTYNRKSILLSYDQLLNKKYQVQLNQKTIDRVKNYFK